MYIYIFKFFPEIKIVKKEGALGEVQCGEHGRGSLVDNNESSLFKRIIQ
jgi:hypothetical protein